MGTTFNFFEEMEKTENSDNEGSVSESEPKETDDKENDEESQPTLGGEL